MQYRTLKKLITIIFVLFIISSCNKDRIVPEPPELTGTNVTPPPDSTENKISYKGEIQPIFTAHCASASCHGGQNDPNLTNSKSYQSLMSISGMIDTTNPGNSILYKEILPPNGKMYQYGNNTKADADSVYKWIRQGAKNN